jgi:ribosomal protein L16 Arg81 hydroxylase
MFNHQDVLRTSSYQAQVAGAKRWHVCAPDQSRYIGPAGGVDAFDPDYTAYPLFRKAQCYDDVVETGEMIFYPADYWHQTENIRTPTISVTSTVMDQNNYELIIAELVAECRTQKFKWGFSPQLCEAIEKRCVPYWGDIFGEKKRKVDEEDQAIQKRHDEL